MLEKQRKIIFIYSAIALTLLYLIALFFILAHKKKILDTDSNVMLEKAVYFSYEKNQDYLNYLKQLERNDKDSNLFQIVKVMTEFYQNKIQSESSINQAEIIYKKNPQSMDIKIALQILKKEYEITDLKNIEQLKLKSLAFILLKNQYAKEKQSLTDLRKKDYFKTFSNLGIYFHDIDVLGFSEQSFQTAKEIDSNDMENLAWQGSLLTKKGRDAEKALDKLDLVNKGLELMDLAAIKEPENYLILMIRIENNLALPEYFDRINFAQADLEFLLKKYETKQKVFDHSSGWYEIDSEKIKKIREKLIIIYQKKGLQEKIADINKSKDGMK